MGKSFNDDVFTNGINIDSINGLNISKEAIQENKDAFSDIEKGLKEKFSNLDIDQVKEEIKASKDKDNEQEEISRLQDEIARLKEKEQQRENKEKKDDKEQYVKKTMIFKQEYLDIINGIATNTNTQVKGVLNRILELGIKEIEKQEGKEVIDKALKNSKKKKQEKAKELIF